MGSLPGAGRVAMALAMREIRVIKHATCTCNGAGASYDAKVRCTTGAMCYVESSSVWRVASVHYMRASTKQFHTERRKREEFLVNRLTVDSKYEFNCQGKLSIRK